MSSRQHYSTAKAAEYLGITLGQMKYYVHTVKEIKPELIGHSLVFTKAQLDEFKPTLADRTPGRNPKILPASILNRLGKAHDTDLAREAKVHPRTIKRTRESRNIEPFRG